MQPAVPVPERTFQRIYPAILFNPVCEICVKWGESAGKRDITETAYKAVSQEEFYIGLFQRAAAFHVSRENGYSPFRLTVSHGYSVPHIVCG